MCQIFDQLKLVVCLQIPPKKSESADKFSNTEANVTDEAATSEIVDATFKQ